MNPRDSLRQAFARGLGRAFEPATLRTLARSVFGPLRSSRPRALANLVEQVLQISTGHERQAFYLALQGLEDRDQASLRHLSAGSTYRWAKRNLMDLRGGLDGLHVLEIGPGHSLGVGTLLCAAGVERYYGVDLTPLATTRSDFYRAVRDELDRVPLWGGDGSARRSFLEHWDRVIDLSEDEARWSPALTYLAPQDAADLPLPDDSLDVVFSCSVLEHVSDLDAVLREQRRVLKPGGSCFHQVDFRDHRLGSSSRDFLQVPDWESTIGPADYTNRLRLSEVLAAVDRAGLTLDPDRLAPGPVEPLAPGERERLTPRFRRMSRTDLETLGLCFAARVT